MIRYRILCERDHSFDSWFDNSASFDRLRDMGLIECPQCRSRIVRKALMTPRINKGADGEAPVEASDAGEPKPQGMLMPHRDEKLAQLRSEAMHIAREIRNHVRNTADYVGDNFAEEARRIHFGEVEPHGIYGEASLDEVRDLAEEGIDVHPLPDLPEDGN